MNALPSVHTASLPGTYEAAKVALAQCERVDECKGWSDKAAALASYAKQADDDQLEKLAMRIRARAIRRAGELLKQFDARGGDRSKKVATLPFGQLDMAAKAGMSPHQTKQAVRVSNIPEASFNKQVESDKPPTIGALASQGIRKRIVPREDNTASQPPLMPKRNVIDLKGRDPKEFNRALHYVADIEEIADKLEELDHSSTLGTLIPTEVEKVRAAVARIDRHTDTISTRI